MSWCRFDSSFDRLGALVRELRPVDSWMLNTPDFGKLPPVVMAVSWLIKNRNKFCLLIGQNLFAPSADPLLSYITSFDVIIRHFDQAGSIRLGTSWDATELYKSRTHHLKAYPSRWGANHGISPCVREGTWCHRALMRLLAVWRHWAPLPKHSEVWARRLNGTQHCCSSFICSLWLISFLYITMECLFGWVLSTGWYWDINEFSLSAHILSIFSYWIFYCKRLCSHDWFTLGISCTHCTPQTFP